MPAVGVLLLMLMLSGCAVGPRYAKPAAQAPPTYKETPLPWKTAQPSDQVARGKWWEIFQDPQLNALEEQINVSMRT
jgi:outer membrane protein TolC